MEPAKNQPQPETSLHFLDYWRIIRIRKTVIISVFLLIAITATIFTFILTPSYSSTARIEINPDGTDIPSMTGIQASAGYDPYFIQTEFEKMQGEKVLGRVIDALDLNNVWGKKTQRRCVAQDGGYDATAQAAHELESGAQHQAD